MRIRDCLYVFYRGYVLLSSRSSKHTFNSHHHCSNTSSYNRSTMGSMRWPGIHRSNKMQGFSLQKHGPMVLAMPAHVELHTARILSTTGRLFQARHQRCSEPWLELHEASPHIARAISASCPNADSTWQSAAYEHKAESADWNDRTALRPVCWDDISRTHEVRAGLELRIC